MSIYTPCQSISLFVIEELNKRKKNCQNGENSLLYKMYNRAGMIDWLECERKDKGPRVMQDIELVDRLLQEKELSEIGKRHLLRAQLYIQKFGPLVSTS